MSWVIVLEWSLLSPSYLNDFGRGLDEVISHFSILNFGIKKLIYVLQVHFKSKIELNLVLYRLHCQIFFSLIYFYENFFFMKRFKKKRKSVYFFELCSSDWPVIHICITSSKPSWKKKALCCATIHSIQDKNRN